MVSSVVAVPAIGKVKREYPESSSDSDKRNPSSLFARILEEKTRESKSEPAAPKDCETTLYDRDSRLRTFQYMTREYHY
ncbi:MAG: hypothetical protein NC079_06530 [Clostridium sp.]|nr:hypothetical protein [Acetatifactor muris]MCM1526385.1 hypothetical protein [Bacteroides sp.]MCM1563252.1 hypothetical protein [Clostridium sp.]